MLRSAKEGRPAHLLGYPRRFRSQQPVDHVELLNANFILTASDCPWTDDDEKERSDSAIAKELGGEKRGDSGTKPGGGGRDAGWGGEEGEEIGDDDGGRSAVGESEISKGRGREGERTNEVQSRCSAVRAQSPVDPVSGP